MNNISAYTREGQAFELELRIKGEGLLPRLQDFQQDWVINKFMNESARDLAQTADLASRFVPGTKRPLMPEGWDQQDVTYDDEQLVLKGHQVMQAWEYEIMRSMAEKITESHGDILEVGFGMGISASCIVEQGVRSYSVVEPNVNVKKQFEKWKEQYPSTPITLIQGNWQDVADQFTQYDGVFFDPYFVSDPGSVEVESSTAVGSFLPLVVPHIREGGVMTHFTREIDSFSRAHQRMLFKYFRSVEISKVSDLVPPDDCNYWWADSMMVVKAIK